MSWLIFAILFTLNSLIVLTMIMGRTDVVDKWIALMIVAPALLKWVVFVGFLRARSPGENAFMVLLKWQWQTWEEDVQHRREVTAYLRDKGILIYDRLLTVVLISGVLAFFLRPAIGKLLLKL